MQKIKLAIATACVLSASPAFAVDPNVEIVKERIFQLAESFRGQGDPDFSKQDQLEPLVDELVALAPQPPVRNRLSLLAGAWQQVWGPYEYRSDERGVDPELGVNEIYQVVSKEGYYYNVSPLYKNGDRAKERIGLLRGEFKLDPKRKDVLTVKFTKYPGLKSRPQTPPLWELAELMEKGKLKDTIKIVPTWIVKLFFNGGELREVYTDADMRIVYGSSQKMGRRESLYVMRRVK